ncbi:MAG: helix-turn-helix domain-containing protein [Tannerellaceae bacterium]|nr:helix-turn-helix domain-containing protein [Tannerellaceae bacterium]
MLIIESNEEVKNSLIEVFSLLYEVSEARNQNEGYTKVLHLLPDIILCEISSEEIGGLELCKQLKSNIKTLQIPFIALTLYPSEEQEIESIQCGADSYFIKPFNVEALFLKCNSLVNNRNQIIYKYTNQKKCRKYPDDYQYKRLTISGSCNKILEAILDNIHFDTTLWSKELGIGRTCLFNQIKNITGMTPNDYILHIKMNKSRILLTQNANLMIAEIGYLLGFSNLAYFSKCFKKQFGITPQEYRKNKIPVIPQQNNNKFSYKLKRSLIG